MNNQPYYAHDEQAIIAQCTPQGDGALALIRLSGVNALSIAAQLSDIGTKRSIATVPSHTIQYGYVVAATTMHEPIDQVLFLVMHGPRTFTGQDTVEITCHNNQFIVQNIIQEAIKLGARLAQEGEFTRRAVLNNKIDLVQAEAVHDLIKAHSQEHLKKSLAQLTGSFSHWISELEKSLYTVIGLAEASFEFIDDETVDFSASIQEQIIAVFERVGHIKKQFNQQQQLKEGARIAFVGSVNAGKSSLFNAVLGKDRAIVTDIAGTTRDTIEAGLYRQGVYWTVIDTAGLRVTDDVVEKIGIERSFAEAESCDILCLVYDGSRSLSAQEKEVYQRLFDSFSHKMIVVQSKIDKGSIPLFDHSVPVSIKQHETVEQFVAVLQQRVSALFSSMDAPFLLNRRHFHLLSLFQDRLAAIIATFDKPFEYEILAYELKHALAELTELTGRSISENSMDKIFKDFCVGK